MKSPSLTLIDLRRYKRPANSLPDCCGILNFIDRTNISSQGMRNLSDAVRSLNPQKQIKILYDNESSEKSLESLDSDSKSQTLIHGFGLPAFDETSTSPQSADYTDASSSLIIPLQQMETKDVFESQDSVGTRQHALSAISDDLQCKTDDQRHKPVEQVQHSDGELDVILMDDGLEDGSGHKRSIEEYESSIASADEGLEAEPVPCQHTGRGRSGRRMSWPPPEAGLRKESPPPIQPRSVSPCVPAGAGPAGPRPEAECNLGKPRVPECGLAPKRRCVGSGPGLGRVLGDWVPQDGNGNLVRRSCRAQAAALVGPTEKRCAGLDAEQTRVRMEKLVCMCTVCISGTVVKGCAGCVLVPAAGGGQSAAHPGAQGAWASSSTRAPAHVEARHGHVQPQRWLRFRTGRPGSRLQRVHTRVAGRGE
mmetsp:Transcript_67701/g.181028  ORF Transcript_67701/g.181028 Transcript_67701/m.181028 type:complete len:422 (-) Transcript_67701:729-1994(-)